ncbi:MAG TPA: DNA gyrase subunit A [Candidatus Azoamicus sp. OHIO2]
MKNTNIITNIFIENELIDSYLNYALSVIIGRALPDVRDGLKPVHRRTLFVMKELNNNFNKNYKKSARIVGDVIGKYHPHGDTAVYDSIVRLSQTFVQRYPLIDGQGNFGSIDGDSPAAMRYTEIKMSELSEYMLKDLDFFTVDYINNYDNTEKYPVIFPTMFPNILINGSCGIAVGMATNIPPHNLTEIINACLVYIKNPDVTINTLLKYILSPDFPTYGSIHGLNNLHATYSVGKGKIIVKAKPIIKYESKTINILITELPYQINKTRLLTKIRSLIKEKRLDGVKFIQDESDKDGLRILISIEKNKNIKIILNKLYDLTNLQNSFNINMLCLVNNTPKLLNIKNIIKLFILHRKEIIYRRLIHIISKIKYKLHLLEPLYIILFNTHKIINLIINITTLIDFKKEVPTLLRENTSIINLKRFGLVKIYLNKTKSYNFSDIQIQTILNTKLSRLIKIEKNFAINDYILFLKDYIYYRLILLNDNLIYNIMKNEFIFIKNKFFDKRKTKIFLNTVSIQPKDLVEKKPVIILLSNNGYLKIQNITDYKSQHRGGKGRESLTYIKYNDSLVIFTLGTNIESLFCFSENGKLYIIELYKLSLSDKSMRGTLLTNIINMDESDKIKKFISLNLEENKDKYIVILTLNGLIKIISVIELKKIKTNGIKVITLNKNDKLVDIKIINRYTELMIFSNTGKTIRFTTDKIKITSRQSQGVMSIRLTKHESVVSLIVPEQNCYILTATENGYSKRSKINEYRLTNRNGRGIITHKFNKIRDNIIAVEKVFDNDYLFIATTSGIIKKIHITEVPCFGRCAKGVVLIKLMNNEKLINIKRYSE